MSTRKIFQFAIEIDGVDQFLIQEVKKPEVEIGAVKHGATNHDVKTAGGIDVADAELRKVVNAVTADGWAWNWLTTAQEFDNGGGIDEQYKKNVVFKELAPDGKTTMRSWLWIGCWVRKVSDSDYKRGNQNENVIETVILSVDKVKKLR